MWLVVVLHALICMCQVVIPGLEYHHQSGYHILRGTLPLNPKLRFAVNTPLGSTRDNLTVSGHAQRLNASAAINANYFDSNIWPCGFARGGGSIFGDAYEERVNCTTTLAWNSGGSVGATIVNSTGHSKDPTFAAQYPDAVTGGGYLLKGGQRHDWNHEKLEEGRDCTAMGYATDPMRFILVVSDDTVCSGKGLQDVLQGFDATDAIHLDGGGSAKMWIQGMGYVNNGVQDRLLPVVVYVI